MDEFGARIVSPDEFPNRLLPRVFGVVLTSVACLTLVSCVGRTPAMPTKTDNGVGVEAGRKPSIPLPDRALLERQPAPNCDRKTAEAASSEPTPREPSSSEPATAGAPANDDQRRLNLQIDCYRQHEAIARDRLLALQISIDKTIKAIKRREAQLEN